MSEWLIKFFLDRIGNFFDKKIDATIQSKKYEEIEPLIWTKNDIKELHQHAEQSNGNLELDGYGDGLYAWSKSNFNCVYL